MIEHQPPSAQMRVSSVLDPEERTRESMGQIVEPAFYENGDLNAIACDGGGGGGTTVVTLSPTVDGSSQLGATTRTSESKSQIGGGSGGGAGGGSTAKRRSALLSCFSNSRTSIFNFKSPKKDKRVIPAGSSGGGGSHNDRSLLATTSGPESLTYRHQKLTSVDSANTISNSSLQEVDDEEFNSSDLVKYMEEINQGIK